MEIIIHDKDLFQFHKNWMLVQCVSADLEMGAGIATEFNRRYDVKNRARAMYPNGFHNKLGNIGGFFLRARNETEPDIYCLVTKNRYFDKPTYKTMQLALKQMCVDYLLKDVAKYGLIAMPAIGCGLDQLNINRVIQQLVDIFLTTNIQIDLCVPGLVGIDPKYLN